MEIGGISIILLFGIFNLILILFQLSTGFRWIKVPFGIHRKTGILLFISSIIHGLLAFLSK
jgi:hypothetical protein